MDFDEIWEWLVGIGVVITGALATYVHKFKHATTTIDKDELKEVNEMLASIDDKLTGLLIFDGKQKEINKAFEHRLKMLEQK